MKEYVCSVYIMDAFLKKGGSSCGAQRGGSGAAEHAISTYGGIGGQQPASATTNVIAMKGGKRRGKGKGKGRTRKGGYGLSQLVVPAALFAANYAYGRRGVSLSKFTRGRRSRSRRSRRFRR